MTADKFVSYIRVSTGKQDRSGLGLEAQRAAITNYLNGGEWELLKEFKEVESGKLDERPMLQEALKLCRLTGATLIIGKLDRLSRDPDFIGAVMKSDVEFIACDMPLANRFTIRIYAALAEQERQFISERTKAALQAAKERGQKLGKPENLSREAAIKGSKQSVTARQRKADNFSAQIAPMIQECKAEGMSLHKIAAKLNERNILTARGKAGSWTATGVKNVLARLL